MKNKIRKIGPAKTNFMSLGFPNWHGFLSNINTAERLPKSSHPCWDKVRMLCTWHLLEMEGSGSFLWRKIFLINKIMACFRPVTPPLLLTVKTTDPTTDKVTSGVFLLYIRHGSSRYHDPVSLLLADREFPLETLANGEDIFLWVKQKKKKNF